MELWPLPDACWVIRHWQGVEVSSLFQQQMLLKGMAQCLKQSCSTLMVDSHRSPGILRWLQQHHFKPIRCKYLYEKRASHREPTQRVLYEVKSLAELGESVFLDYLSAAATQAPDASAAANPQQAFQELLLHAGDAFNTAQWFVVFQEQAAVGVLLPQVFADSPREGTLSYIGVMPCFRRQGHGVRLHQWGLSLLFSWGVQRYLGSTGQSNIAMQRVFEKSQCTRLGTRYFLTP